MTTSELDPLIHVPTRLKIVATLVGPARRRHALLHPPAGHDRAHPRHRYHPPAQARSSRGDLTSSKTSNGSASKTTVALTGHGRKALDSYTQALRDLLGGL